MGKIKLSSLVYRISFWGVSSSSIIKGKTKNVSKKTEFWETQQERLTCDHAEPIKTENLNQSSKEFRCPVTFAVMKIYSFPEHKNSSDTKRQGINTSLKLKDILSNILQYCEEKKSRDFKLPGQLNCITCFPTVV